MIAGRLAGSTGRQVRALAALLLMGVAAGGCTGEPTAATPPCIDAQVLIPGQPLTAWLGAGDRRGGAFIDYYAIYPPGPSTGRIQLTSTSFDPFLLLFDAGGQALDQAHDPEPGDGVRTVVLTWPMSRRCYLVGASSWDRDATGAYILSLQWEDSAS